MKRSGLKPILVALAGACLLCGGCTYLKPSQYSLDARIHDPPIDGYMSYEEWCSRGYPCYDWAR